MRIRGNHDLIGHRQLVFAEYGFGQGFVHCHGAAMNVAADIGKTQYFQKTLDRTVFAGWSMQSRKYNLGLKIAEAAGGQVVQFQQGGFMSRLRSARRRPPWLMLWRPRLRRMAHPSVPQL